MRMLGVHGQNIRKMLAKMENERETDKPGQSANWFRIHNDIQKPVLC